MEIRNIVTFLKVAGTQNFSNAAEQLGYSQSAVTVQILSLIHISIRTRCYKFSLPLQLEPRNAYFTGFLGSFYV